VRIDGAPEPLGPRVGDPAPALRLPSGQGGEVALEDFLGRRNVVVWFNKGMACAFCRQSISQLARTYDAIRSQDGEVVLVTPTPLARARVYAKQFPLPFPYLSDPDFRARRGWGLGVRAQGPVWYVVGFALYHVHARSMPRSDIGNPTGTLGEMPSLLADDDMGLFVVDKAGIVRFAAAGRSAVFDEATGKFVRIRGIPSTEAIVAALRECQAQPAPSPARD
jgi:peroxiredoxin